MGLPISPCMSCCQSSTGAFSRAPSPSRMRCRATTRSPSPPSPAGPSRTASLSWLIALPHLARLQRTPRSERRIAVLMPDYPGAAGRTAYAVGLDVPASIVALIADLADAGYQVDWRSAKLAGAARGGGGGHRRARTFAARLSPPARRASGRGRGPRRSGVGRARSRSRCQRRRLPLPRRAIRQSAGGIATRSRARRQTGAPPITIRRCRRAMRCSPSVYGCATSPRPMPSCIWAHTAHSNGCPARLWR